MDADRGVAGIGRTFDAIIRAGGAVGFRRVRTDAGKAKIPAASVTVVRARRIVRQASIRWTRFGGPCAKFRWIAITIDRRPALGCIRLEVGEACTGAVAGVRIITGPQGHLHTASDTCGKCRVVARPGGAYIIGTIAAVVNTRRTVCEIGVSASARETEIIRTLVAIVRACDSVQDGRMRADPPGTFVVRASVPVLVASCSIRLLLVRRTGHRDTVAEFGHVAVGRGGPTLNRIGLDVLHACSRPVTNVRLVARADGCLIAANPACRDIDVDADIAQEGITNVVRAIVAVIAVEVGGAWDTVGNLASGTPAIDANIAERATVIVVAGRRAGFKVRHAHAATVAEVGVVAQRVGLVPTWDRRVQQRGKHIDGTCDLDAVTNLVLITLVDGGSTDGSSGRNAVDGACF